MLKHEDKATGIRVPKDRFTHCRLHNGFAQHPTYNIQYLQRKKKVQTRANA